MKLVVIPPYRLAGVNFTPTEGHFVLGELISNMKAKGQLAGVDIDIDEGFPSEHKGENRDEEVIAAVTVGFLKRVRAVNEMNKYDAIVSSGATDKGVDAARMISKIPITFSVHSSVHMASLIGDRFSIIFLNDALAVQVRHSVELYGLSNKLVSIRSIGGRSTPNVFGLIRRNKKEDRYKDPEVVKLVDDVVSECIKAIEEDRADTLIIGLGHLQVFIDEIRRRLDEAGYDEIRLICGVAAAVEMAKALVNLKLSQAPRAYPSGALKAKPKFR